MAKYRSAYNRDDVDSGWAITQMQLAINYKRENSKVNRRQPYFIGAIERLDKSGKPIICLREDIIQRAINEPEPHFHEQ